MAPHIYKKCAVHVLCSLPPPDPGAWAMAREEQPLPDTGLPGTKCPQPLASAPATKARSLWLGWQQGGSREIRPNSSARHGLASFPYPPGPAQLTTFFQPQGLAPAVSSALKALPSPLPHTPYSHPCLALASFYLPFQDSAEIPLSQRHPPVLQSQVPCYKCSDPPRTSS